MAHGENWENAANGKCNLHTKKIDIFEDNKPQINYCKLYASLSDRTKRIATTKYENTSKQRSQ